MAHQQSRHVETRLAGRGRERPPSSANAVGWVVRTCHKACLANMLPHDLGSASMAPSNAQVLAQDIPLNKQVCGGESTVAGHRLEGLLPEHH